MAVTRTGITDEGSWPVLPTSCPAGSTFVQVAINFLDLFNISHDGALSGARCGPDSAALQGTCGSFAEFHFLTLEIIEIDQKGTMWQLLNLCQ